MGGRGNNAEMQFSPDDIDIYVSSIKICHQYVITGHV